MIPGSGKSREGNGNLTPVVLPGKSHERRSLVGYSPWGHKRVGYDLTTKRQQQRIVISQVVGLEIRMLLLMVSSENTGVSRLNASQRGSGEAGCLPGCCGSPSDYLLS